jgi:uncharacterized protein (UPF0216 family)
LSSEQSSRRFTKISGARVYNIKEETSKGRYKLRIIVSVSVISDCPINVFAKSETSVNFLSRCLGNTRQYIEETVYN